MLSIAVLTNEVCTAWSDAFFMLASNGTTVWLCIVNSVSFISMGGCPLESGPSHWRRVE